jgi:hypothetical protein
MFDTMSDLDATGLVAVVESTHREESKLMARRMTAVAALLRNRAAAAKRAEGERGYSEIDGFDQTKAEVAAAMNLSPLAASYLVLDAPRRSIPDCQRLQYCLQRAASTGARCG